MAASLEQVAASYSAIRNVKGAIACWMQAKSLFRKADDQLGEARTVWELSQAMRQLNDESKAIEYGELAVSLYTAAGSPIAERLQAELADWKRG